MKMIPSYFCVLQTFTNSSGLMDQYLLNHNMNLIKNEILTHWQKKLVTHVRVYILNIVPILFFTLENISREGRTVQFIQFALIIRLKFKLELEPGLSEVSSCSQYCTL